MLRNKILASLAVGFLLGLTSNVASAEMPTASSNETQFHSIEQPLGLKLGVTVGGIALIGLELWWFLFSKSQSQQAKASEGVQEITITVDGGYEPSRVVVKVGQPVKINFVRRDPSSCLEKVLFPDFHIAQNLALNNITKVEFTPENTGEFHFTCGMNMFRGVVEVQS